MSDSSDNTNGGDSDSDDDQDLFDDSRRQQRRQRSRDEAIYGVFYDDDDNNNNNNNSYNRRGGGGSGNQGRGRRGGYNDGLNIAPQFVKGGNDDDVDNGNNNKDDEEDDEDIFGAKKSSDDTNMEDGDSAVEKKQPAVDDDVEKNEDEEPTEEEKAQEEALKKQQESADDYFLSLLKRGKGEHNNDRKSVSSSFQSSVKESTTRSLFTEASSTSSLSNGGLGFHGGGSSGGGLGFTAAAAAVTTTTTTDKFSPSFTPMGLGMQQQGTAGSGMQAGLGMQQISDGQVVGMPTAFGGNHNRPTSRRAEKPERSFVKDPNLGSWEKHTKGIGMKLLAKMGYKGSGGLGSMRRNKTVVDETTGQAVEVEQPVKAGISRPVEVVVRPNNLGLGYGNFKEATKLKTNQQIEAEVRGVDPKKLKKEEESKKSKDNNNSSSAGRQQEGHNSSALPSVQELMQQKSWKRGMKQNQASRKRARRTVIPYQELLEKHASQPSVVIDMRGPSTTAPDGQSSQLKEVPLAEELLHNMSLLLNTYENKIHSGSHFVRSTKQKVESLQSDIASMEQRQKDNQNRVKKLRKVLETIDKIEAIVNSAPLLSSSNDSSTGSGAISKVQSLVGELECSFTEEERVKLRFFEVLAPSLLEPVLQARLAQWDPLTSDVNTTNSIMDDVIGLGRIPPMSSRSSHNEEAGFVMMRSMFNKILLPRVKQALESLRWDPIHDVEVGLQLYESICRVASNASPPSSRSRRSDDGDHFGDNGHILPTELEETKDGSARLKDLVQEEIIHKTVYFKLARALSQWKPTLDESGTGLKDRPHLWILPWIPHLDHRSILPTLLADCKRKLKSAVSFLQKIIDDDETFCRATLQMLRPWCNIFPREIVSTLVSTTLVSRTASSVAAAASSAFRNKNDVLGCPTMGWNAVDMAYEMHSSGLLTDKEFLSIIEGELLPRWASRLHAWLRKDPSAWNEAAQVYTEWRIRLFTDTPPPATTSNNSPAKNSRWLSEQQCLSQDLSICTLFYAVLLMLQAAQQSNGTRSADLLEDLRPPPTNVRAVLARRTREERERTRDELLRMEATGVAGGGANDNMVDPAVVEARVRAAHRYSQENGAGHTPSFREVVEEFAQEQNVLFQPRMGSNATRDGKSVFLFGKIPIYLDSDVVFALQNSEWNPTSLGQLAMMANANNKN